MPNTLDCLLIVCEGETEKEYLSALADQLAVMPRVSIRKTAACAPMSLLEEAYKEFMWSNATDKLFPFTEIWCVFDRDHHPSYDTTFEVAKTLRIPVHLCWTNPCIEFWFWLHYCGDKNHLKFDEFAEIGRTQERVMVSTDVFGQQCNGYPGLFGVCHRFDDGRRLGSEKDVLLNGINA